MSGKQIKGITIEIDGQTKPLQKALEDVNKKTRDLQGELKSVDRLLKLDPKNTELLAQKQKLLAEQVDNSRQKLDHLKRSQDQVTQAFKKGDIGEEQYRHFSRQVINAEQDLKKFERQLKDTGKTADRTGERVKAAGKKMKDIGQGMTLGITAPLVGGAVALSETTREMRGDLARLEANAITAGQEMNVLNDAMAKMYAVTFEIDSNVEGLSNILATGFKDEKLSELVEAMAGASIKFADTLKFEGIADGLQETLATGKSIGMFDELLSRSGVNLDEWNEGLTEAIASGRQQEYVLETLAKTGLKDVYQEYRKNNEEMLKAAEAQYKLQTAMGELATAVEPLITPVIEKITEMITKFNEMDPAGQKTVMAIGVIAAAIGPLLMIIGQLILAGAGLKVLLAGGAGVAGAAGAGGGLAGAMAALANPVGLVVAAVLLLVATFAILWKTSGKFRQWLREIGQGFEHYLKDKINGFIDDINWMIEQLNRLPKVEIDPINKLVKSADNMGFADFKLLPGNNYTGTDFWRGGLSWVGEKGPELLNLPRGSQILSHQQSMAAVNNQTVNHTGTVYHVFQTNDRQTVAKIAEEFERGNRRIPARVATLPSMA